MLGRSHVPSLSRTVWDLGARRWPQTHSTVSPQPRLAVVPRSGAGAAEGAGALGAAAAIAGRG